MKMPLLLLLSLTMMTGCMASSDERECREGWVNFICKYPKTKQELKYESVTVIGPQKTSIQTTKKDVWEDEGGLSLYHDTKTEKLKVAIDQRKHEDFGKYKCTFHKESKSRKSDTEGQKLVVDENACPKPFSQTVYRTARTTISCNYPGPRKLRSTVRFFCKENGAICEDIFSTSSSVKPNGTFTVTDTDTGFNVSISNVSKQHGGVYWCGSNTGSYRTAVRMIKLKFQDSITNFTRSPTVGQNLTYWCQYKDTAAMKRKFICKGEDPSICPPLSNVLPIWNFWKSTMTAEEISRYMAIYTTNTEKFSMKEAVTTQNVKDDGVRENITITIRKVMTEDSGTYWCGAESSDPMKGPQFFHRVQVTVVSPTPSPVTTQAPLESRGGFWIVVAVIVCVAVLLLVLFILILILIYKRFSSSKNTSDRAAAQNSTEEFVYEDIPERRSGKAVNTIYATVDVPKSPSEPQVLYSTVNFKIISDKAGASEATPPIRSSSSACEYSTVKFSQIPDSSTVDGPLYATVNKAKK